MKKLLLTILIILLAVLTYVVMFSDFRLGVLHIESIAEIKTHSEELDNKLSQATTLTAQEYPKIKSDLDSAINEFKTTKQQYENKVASMPDSEVLKYMQVDNYEKDFLWTTIGTYATKENLDLELNIKDIENNDYYNLSFKVVGKYSDIADFIFSIENDDDLGFRIENFTMKPYTLSEITTITKYENGEPNEEESTDDAYNTIKEKEFTDIAEAEETESKEENKTTKDDSISSLKKNNQTGNSVSVRYNPDRVEATFVVKKVNVNMD